MAKSHWYDPQGADKVRLQTGVYADSSSAGVWISGHGAPPSGSGLLPLDGVNDPSRWAPQVGAWLGPAYRVSWHAGARVTVPPVPDGVQEFDVYVIPQETLDGVSTGLAPAAFTAVLTEDVAGALGPRLCAASVRSPYPDVPAGSSGVMAADADGSGVAFVAQFELGWTGPTAVPDPTAMDPRPYLAELTVGAPFEFSETAPLGTDGQFYLDLDSRDVHLRMNGAWTKVATLPAPS